MEILKKQKRAYRGDGDETGLSSRVAKERPECHGLGFRRDESAIWGFRSSGLRFVREEKSREKERGNTRKY